jgi:hypothetical protein
MANSGRFIGGLVMRHLLGTLAVTMALGACQQGSVTPTDTDLEPSTRLAVTLEFDEEGEFTGGGFVGKGDVQSAFGWNNAEMNANAPKVTFSYSIVEIRERECQTAAPPGPPVRVEVTITRDVGADVAFTERKNSQGQLTGFVLTGFEGDEDVVVTVDPPCGGQLVGANTLIEKTEAMFVHFDGEHHQIWASEED